MTIVDLDSRRQDKRAAGRARLFANLDALATQGKPAAELGISDADANRDHARRLRQMAPDCGLVGPMLEEFAARAERNSMFLDALDGRR